MRKVVGIVAGLVLAFVLAILLKAVSDYFFAPAALDPSDPEQAGQIMSLMPTAGLISTLLIFFLATLAGAFTAAKVAHARWAAWATGALMLLITGTRAVMGNYPGWLTIATLVMIGLAAWFAGVMAGDSDGDEEEDEAEPAPAAWAVPAEPEPQAQQGWPEQGYEDPDPAAAPEPERPRWTPLPPPQDD